MSEFTTRAFLFTLLVAIASLILAYLLDTAYSLLADQARDTLQIMPAATFVWFRGFLLVSLIVGLSWFTLVKLPLGRWAAMTYFVFGLTIEAVLLSIFFGFPPVLRSSLLEGVRIEILRRGLPSGLAIIGDALAVLGVVGYFRKGERRQT